MVELASPIGPTRKSGRHGATAAGVGVTLSELRRGSIVEVAAWTGRDEALRTAIASSTGLSLPATPTAGTIAGSRAGFGIGPGRYLLTDEAAGMAERLSGAIAIGTGSVTDLSHGRTAIRVEGPKAEWVLAKLFAVDFAPEAFPPGAGRATTHHDIAALIQRADDDAFDLHVFRSFARNFWTTLCHAAGETGYEVV